ncbi:hypothetical protein E2C01_009436 [Portunus trituberculatus]|uniref:Uncharacterized protein n=1 Tax=Portunus trituberculatus TaxID=210409 RepID=A0A5B7D3J1_PORTR|nr:hypothetical protein [Portunus trituberculatus]
MRDSAHRGLYPINTVTLVPPESQSAVPFLRFFRHAGPPSARRVMYQQLFPHLDHRAAQCSVPFRHVMLPRAWNFSYNIAASLSYTLLLAKSTWGCDEEERGHGPRGTAGCVQWQITARSLKTNTSLENFRNVSLREFFDML